MSLVDELKVISGRKKRYLLLRIIDMNPESSRQLCGIAKGTYNSWLQNDAFVLLHRRIAEFAAEYQKEALQLLRRNNQQKAVLLEEKILAKIDAELDSGEYDLIRTNLGKEVYTKLISDLDYQPQNLSFTYMERIHGLGVGQQPAQIEQEGVIDGEVIEATTEPTPEHSESSTVTEDVQASQQAQEETCN